jgi:hypothetical protein
MSRRNTFYVAVTALAVATTVAATAAQPLLRHPNSTTMTLVHPRPAPEPRQPPPHLHDLPVHHEPGGVLPPGGSGPAPTPEPGCPNCYS